MDVWNKIEEFQKKGAAQNFAQTIEGAIQFNNLNAELITVSEKILNDEEQEDNALRAQHGAQLNRVPSASINGQYKQQLIQYKEKLGMAASTDT